MARIRTIKPDFFKHEELYQAEQDSGMPLRVAYAGLWTAADRSGRFRWRPRQLKLDCLPYDEIDFSRVLDALATRGFIVKYALQGEEYGYIPSWDKHQIINNREKGSDLPEPNENNILTRSPRVDDACPTPAKGKGKEGEGKGKGTEVRADARDAEFGFLGAVVRLKVKDFAQWQSAYSNLDLKAELVARDAWLAGEATEEDRRKWFITTSKYLANRNAEAKARGSGGLSAIDRSCPPEIYRGVL
jgi:hypothetical protein